MNQTRFQIICISIALLFFAIFMIVVFPALLQDGDIIGGFAAGFVNPYATGYSIDVILCWVTLAVWVVYDAQINAIKYGWICLLIGIVPGVAVGFPLYLVLRVRQLQASNA